MKFRRAEGMAAIPRSEAKSSGAAARWIIPLLFLAQATYAAEVTLTWTPPTTYTDGSPLTDLTGYQFHYGCQQSGSYPSSTPKIANPSMTSYVISGLPDATQCWFVAQVYNSADVFSTFSNEATTTTASGPPSQIPYPDPGTNLAVTWQETPSSPPMAVAHVNDWPTGASPDPFSAASFDSIGSVAPANGNNLLVLVATAWNFGGSFSISSVTDAHSTWTRRFQGAEIGMPGTNMQRTEIWTAPATNTNRTRPAL